MEGHELLTKVNRVKAPLDFEDGVLARLVVARRARARRQAAFRYGFAGSAAVLLVGFMLLYHPIAGRRTGLTVADRGRPETAVRQLSFAPAARDASERIDIPVLETVDYSSEFRSASHQPRTVYILEQVSEVRPSEIKY